MHAVAIERYVHATAVVHKEIPSSATIVFVWVRMPEVSLTCLLLSRSLSYCCTPRIVAISHVYISLLSFYVARNFLTTARLVG